TGIALDRIQVALGDTRLPRGPISGGSAATASVVPAVLAAARKAVQGACKLAVGEKGPFAGRQASELRLRHGRLRLADDGAGAGVPLAEVLAAAGVAAVSGDGHAAVGRGPMRPYSIDSCCAHFGVLSWHPASGVPRVACVVSVIDGGGMINRSVALNQIEGAIVTGVGMALLEQTHYVPRSGAPVNSN